MEQIKLLRRYYSGEEEITFTDIPKDLQFVKLYQYNDNQQYWMTMFLHNDELSEKLSSLCSRSFTLGKVDVVYFYDVKFITDIPICTLDFFKNKYKFELSNLYIKHISREYDLLRIFKVVDFLGNKVKVSTAHFMGIIGKTEINCIDIDDIEVDKLVNNKLGDAITSSGHWSVCSYDDEIKDLYNKRIKFLSSF